MPLEKERVYGQFRPFVTHFVETPESLFASHNAVHIAFLKQKQNSSLLQSVAMFFPLNQLSFDPDFRKLLEVFWEAVMPPNTLPLNCWDQAVEELRVNGSYDATFDDVFVSLLRNGDQCRLQALTL